MSLEFEYFYGNESEQYSFYRIPKVLFKDKCFKCLSTDAKVLYGLLLDRMGLSIKNRWFDEDNKVYIIYTLQEIMEDFGCADQKATKLFRELDTGRGIGLIERKRQGLGKPDVIYVKNFILPTLSKNRENHESSIVKITNQQLLESQVLTRENHESAIVNNTNQESLKSRPSNTNINNTDYNDTDISDTEFSKTDNVFFEHPSHLSYRSDSKPKKIPMDMMDEYNKYKELIKENIEYDSLIVQEHKDLVDNIVDIMADVVSFPAESYYINQKNYPASIIKSVFLKINNGHISNMIMALDENQTKIRNIRSYLIAAIFNSYSTSEAYITERVRYDMQNWSG